MKPIPLNTVRLKFTNLTGNSSNVFFDGVLFAHLRNNGGELSMNPDEFHYERNSHLGPEFTDDQIVKEFIRRRKAEWAKVESKLDGGWTQWDSLQYQGWEETNRGRLKEALKPFGLKITFDDVAGTSWFKITKA